MQLFITILHVMLSLALILIILLQPGKEGAAVFGGGGGNQAYGPRGQANFLGRATTLVAAMFMVTSITLAYRSSTRTQAGTGNLEEAIEEGLELEAVPMLTSPGGAPVDAAPPVQSNDANSPAAAPEGDEATATPAPSETDAEPEPEADTPSGDAAGNAEAAQTTAPSPEVPTGPAEQANP